MVSSKILKWIKKTAAERKSLPKLEAALLISNQEKLALFVQKTLFLSPVNKQTLQEALRNQALTALTSNFRLVGLVQYTW